MAEREWTLRERLRELHRNPLIALFFLAALCAIFTVLHRYENGVAMGVREMWLDEASTYLVASYPPKRVIELSIELHSQPPLYYLLLHAWSALGTNEATLRNLSWWCCLLLVYFVLLDLNEIGFLARTVWASLFVVSDYTRFLSQELRPYSLAALTTFVSSVLLLRLTRTPRRRWLALAYGVSATAMLYTLAFDAWVIAAHWFFVLVAFAARSRRGGLRRAGADYAVLVGVLVLVSILYLPYLRWVTAAHPPTTPRPPLLDMLKEATKLQYIDTAFDDFLALKPPWSLLIWALILAGLMREGLSSLLWLLLFFGQIWFVYAFLLGRLPVAVRYLTPGVPVLWFGVALACEHLSRARTRARPLLTIALILFVAAFHVRASYADARTQKPAQNWRKLYQELQKLPGKKVIFFSTGFYGQMLAYVARKDPSLVFLTLGYENVPGRSAGAGGERLTREYVEQGIRTHEADTHCFFYSLDHRKRNRALADDPFYEDTFITQMQALGFTEALTSTNAAVKDAMHDAYEVHGYCREGKR